MIIQFDCKIFNPGSDAMRVHWDGWMRVRCVEDENESTLSDTLAPHMRSRICCGGGPWLHREPPLTMSWLLVADKVQQFSSAVGYWRELIELKIVTFSASTISLWLVESDLVTKILASDWSRHPQSSVCCVVIKPVIRKYFQCVTVKSISSPVTHN